MDVLNAAPRCAVEMEGAVAEHGFETLPTATHHGIEAPDVTTERAMEAPTALAEHAVDVARLKGAFGSFPSGVTVVTAPLTATGAGPGWRGMTANAFCALSLDPPLALVCVDKSAHMHDVIRESGVFAVNVLSSAQEHLSRRFAAHGLPIDGEIDAIVAVRGTTGAPILAGACAFIECLLHHAYDGGDHTIYVGAVRAVGADPDARPLLYHRGRYVDWPTDATTGRADGATSMTDGAARASA